MNPRTSAGTGALGDGGAFRAIFFDEADEHLANIETVLLRMDVDAPAADDLNAIFRAAHSIKGSGAMLGFAEIAALTHVLENLLDLLRKDERGITKADIDAMLAAGDTVKLQVAHRRGLIDEPPNAESAEALLRACVAAGGAAGSSGGAPGRRSFAVRLGPLAAPLDPAELDMMLTGLAEMGSVDNQSVENQAGGVVRFDVTLEGAEMDLRSVLSLVVAPGEIQITKLEAAAGAGGKAASSHQSAGQAAFAAEAEAEDEFFVDPAEFKSRARKLKEQGRSSAGGAGVATAQLSTEAARALEPAAVALGVPAMGAFDRFVTAEELKSKRRAPVDAAAHGAAHTAVNIAGPGEMKTTAPLASEARTAGAVMAALSETEPPTGFEAPSGVDGQPRRAGRRAMDAVRAPVERFGRRGADRLPGSAAGDATSIRVATEKIDLLVNLVGELVITEAMLSRHGAQRDELDGSSAAHGGGTGLADLARHTRNLQEAVLAIRMVPISTVFSRFPRLVRELSEQMDKRVELKTTGEATELDRGLIEKISDPLTHLVRNAIDHGLEKPEARQAAGKPAVGIIMLSASQRGGNIVIEVTDDGRGLDRARILARAAERGNMIAADAPDSEVWQLIFEAGFSTAESVTEVSGRGVGMDVVKRNIMSLSGTVDLVSQPGRGTRVTVHVPLTLAIMEAMTVSIGGEIYVLPLSSVIESRRLEAGEVHALPGQGETLRVRDNYLPVLRLAKLFPPRQLAPEDGGIAVIVEGESGNAAIVVDELVGQQQVVVKTLEANFRRVPGLSGATIMGDGRVALILDVGHLIQTSGRGGRMVH